MEIFQVDGHKCCYVEDVKESLSELQEDILNEDGLSALTDKGIKLLMIGKINRMVAYKLSSNRKNTKEVKKDE